LGIKYNPLSAATRKQIWQTFVHQSTGGKADELLNDAVLEEISEYEFDGRMIKNAVRMAHAVATDESVDLNVSHMRKAIRSLQDFKKDMELADKEEEEEAQEASSALTKTSSRKRKRVSSPIDES
jgi:DNA polymerase III delta prime subunit